MLLTGPGPEEPKEDEILEEEAKKPKDPPESHPKEEPEAPLNHQHEEETLSPPEKESNNETTPDGGGEYADGEGEGNKAQGFLDKFSEPVIKHNKLHNPSNEYIGAKHSAGTDKFSEPVLQVKINAPTSAHVGQKHSATGLDFHNSPKDAVKTANANRNEWGKQGPKGNFQWVQVGGTWKKQYDESNNAGAAAPSSPSPQQEEQPTMDSNSDEE